MRTSVQRAVDSLDAPTLRVLDALARAASADGTVEPPDAARLLDGDRPGELTERGVAQLRELALVWGEGPRVHLVPAAGEAIAAAAADAPALPAGAEPPTWQLVQRTPDELDRLGTTAVLETLRLVSALADAWSAEPPRQLRSGGLGTRDLRRSARDLGVGEPALALIIETAGAAGLINATTGTEPVFLPTEAYDAWLHHEPAARWSELALAWLHMTRQPSLVNARGERDRLITTLSPDAERGTMPALRAHVLDVLAQLPPGTAVSSQELLERMAWLAPRRAARQRPDAAAILAEADTLGITAAGGLTGYSRTLRAGSRAVAEQVLASALPAPVDHFLLQPDLTVVVPGPPTPALAGELALLADLESTGGAYVYRISESSVRRALDAGRSAEQLHALVGGRSRTPTPQALNYLIDDAARRHGVLRAGAASAYLRSSDEALLARVSADRGLAAAQLRRIAPTVLLSGVGVGRLVHLLREAGYAPAAEAPDGELITLPAEQPRAPSRESRRALRSRGVDRSQLAQLVRRIRAGEVLSQSAARTEPVSRQPTGTAPTATMELLRDAIREGRRVLLGCAEPDGTTTRHTILPISMAGGYVRGHEPDEPRLQSFPLHRLTGVSVIDDDEPA